VLPLTALQNLNHLLDVISDPYVKLCLKSPDRRVEKRKTKTVKCTLNPIFNEAFNFNVANTNMETSSLEIVVMDFDNIGRDELIGRILLAGNFILFSLMGM
jgi:synaptotagmin-1